MKSVLPNNEHIQAEASASGTPWLWIFGSGIGAMVGAILALIFFPSAGFSVNPTGQFRWSLVGFAFVIGISFAVSQWLILTYVPQYRKTVKTQLLGMLIPVTSIGITLMILPLWWWNATVFINAPWNVVIPMLPGMVLLGLGQWFVMYGFNFAKATWALFTIIGAMSGAVIGLVVAFFLPIPLEATWAFVTAAGIGAFQGFVLTSD